MEAESGTPASDQLEPYTRVWSSPSPLGRGAALEGMAGVVAPLLAGFSLTLLGVVAQAPESFRLPAICMAVLAVAVIGFVTCVQLGFRARSFHYSQQDLEAWYPAAGRPDWITERLQATQRQDHAQWEKWQGWAGFSYNASVMVLAIGLSLVFVPPATYGGFALTGSEYWLRWAGFAISLLGGVAEGAWILHDLAPSRKSPHKVGDPQ